MYTHKPILPLRAATALFVALVVVTVAVACHKRQPAPSAEEQPIVAAAQGYLDAMANYDMDAAIPFASRETREGTIPFFRTMIAKCDSSYIRRNTPASIQIDSIRRQPGDSTAIAFFTKTTPVQTQHQQLTLIKRQGIWQAHVLTRAPEVLKPHRPLTDEDLKHLTIHKEDKHASSTPSQSGDNNK